MASHFGHTLHSKKDPQQGRLGQPNQTRQKKNNKKTPQKKREEITVLPSSHKPKEIKRLVKSHPKVGGRDGAETYFLKSNLEF